MEAVLDWIRNATISNSMGVITIFLLVPVFATVGHILRYIKNPLRANYVSIGEFAASLKRRKREFNLLVAMVVIMWLLETAFSGFAKNAHPEFARPLSRN